MSATNVAREDQAESRAAEEEKRCPVAAVAYDRFGALALFNYQLKLARPFAAPSVLRRSYTGWQSTE